MRHIPSDRHASVLLSALRETAASQEVPGAVAGPVHAVVAAHLEATEAGDEKKLTRVDEKIARGFVEWGKALAAGDLAAAEKWEARIDALAVDHPFPYAETKKLFYAYQSKSSYAHALKSYRAWDGSDPEFAVVEAKVPGQGKVAVFGDWGTGTSDAKLLFTEMMKHRPDVLLHLGDIYEAGTPYECQAFFLGPIEAVCEENGWARPPILAIPGNHEYFTAAAGYFELIDALNTGHGDAWRQQASFFCLRSDDGRWQFLGVDTELEGIREDLQPGLQPTELAWHRDKLASFAGRSVLLSHHQLVSADKVINPRATGTDYQYFNANLVDGFKAALPDDSGTYFDRIDQWLWGHDHWFVPYVDGLPIPAPGATGLKLKRGQLLGGSARETGEGKRSVRFESAVQRRDAAYVLPAITNDDLYNHTYGILDLGAATASYYQVPAWLETNPSPDKTVPTAPLHVERL